MKKSLLSVFCVAALLCAGGLNAKTFYVSPSGSESADGSQSAPFATLEKARDAVREFRAQIPNESVTVQLAGGRYTQTQPLVFTPADSGSKDAPVVWQGAEGERAVISGGLVLSGWKDEGNGLFSAPVPKSLKTGGPAEFQGTQLFVERKVKTATGTFLDVPYTPEHPDVRRATCARTPNVDPEDPTASYFWAKKINMVQSRSAEGYVVRPEDFRAALGFGPDTPDEKLADPASFEGALFYAYLYWSTSYNRIESYDPATGTVTFTRQTGVFFPNRNMRWHLENCRAALDVPGEWFLDRKAGRVFYIPREDEDLTRDAVILSVCPRWLVEIQGNWQNGKPVEYLSFQNLVFSYSDADISPDYKHSVQAADTQRGTINAFGWEHSFVRDCEFSHLGENGISLCLGCVGNVIERNHVFDCGAGGITIPESPKGVEKEKVEGISRENLIRNNLIHHTGQMFQSACGIFFSGLAQNNTVINNEISDTTWAGVQMGWSWGAGQAWTNHNDLGWNHIHHVSGGRMNDLAGIYMLGDQNPTRVHHNWIHNVYRYTRDTVGYGGWGLYGDAGHSNITWDFNLVHDTQDNSLHIHNYAFPYGCIFANNIFAYSDAPSITRGPTMNTEKEFGSDIHQNISFNPNNQEMLAGIGFPLAPERTLRMNRNVFWNPLETPTFRGKTFDEWKNLSACDTESILADPKFRDPENRDFRLAADSPAFSVGFQNFDLVPRDGQIPDAPQCKAGLYGDAAWVGLAAKIIHRPVEYHSVNCATDPYVADFEDLEAPTDRPAGVSVYTSAPEGTKTGAEVTTEQAFQGKKAYKFTDSPANRNSYDPHITFESDFPKGMVEASFAVRKDEKVHLHVETRQYAEQPGYASGPTFEVFPDGKVSAGGKVVTQIPNGQWVRFTLSLPNDYTLGMKARAAQGKLRLPEIPPIERTWSLTVTQPDGKSETFGPFPVPEKFQALQWIGILSLGQEGVYYLDDVEVKRK
ncbi:MAG: right-handed parallel beta-helix repeat-containing protein [Thermoguttaceae bacterium]|nr:right-handed parallel beta-helix repeat-containing protein [Thermoguttaceae bacterium]